MHPNLQVMKVKCHGKFLTWLPILKRLLHSSVRFLVKTCSKLKKAYVQNHYFCFYVNNQASSNEISFILWSRIIFLWYYAWATWSYLFHALFPQQSFLAAGQTRQKTNGESNEGQNERKMRDKHNKIFARNIFLIINKNPSPGVMTLDHQTSSWPPQTPVFAFCQMEYFSP